MKFPRDIERVLKHYRQTGELLLAEHDGDIWASERYTLFRVVEHSPVRKLLDAFNLDLKPGRYEVGVTIVQAGESAADAGKIIDSLDDNWPTLTRRMIGQCPVLVEDASPSHVDVICEVWDSPSGPVLFNHRYTRFLSTVALWDTARCAPETPDRKPTLLLNGSTVNAVVMPLVSDRLDEVES